MKRLATKSGIKAAALAVLSVLLLTGCEDPRRVSWSPDGSTAAVIAGDGLRISDADGNIGEPKPGVELVNWFPDGRRLLLVEYEKVDTWAKLQQLETPEDLKRVMDTAAKMLVSAKLNKGNWEKFEKSVTSLSHNREAVIYLRENKDKEMTAMGEPWVKVKKTVDVGVHRICSYEVANKALNDRKEIYKTMRDVKEVRLSPHGKAFLLVYKQEQDDDSSYTLAHVAVDNGAASTISSAAAMYPDWSLDGKEIYFVEADLPAGAREGVDWNVIPLIGALTAQSVDPETESLAKDVKKRQLSRLLFLKSTRVRALADGGIVFSAAPVQLPGSDTQIVRKQSLYVVRPNQSALVAQMMPSEEPEVGGDLVEYFEINRSGSLISIPSSKEGTIVYNVKTGSSTRIDGYGFAWSKRLSFVPTWRSDDELCLGMKPAKATEKEDVSEVVLWTMSKENVRSLSRDWPEIAKNRFLEHGTKGAASE